MRPLYKLIASFVHGNALGVVVQPVDGGSRPPHRKRKDLWQVRIGPLLPEIPRPVS